MSLNRFLRGLLIGGIFLTPVIPFIVAEFFFFPFITGKNFAFRILTEVLFGLWVMLMIREPSLRPRFSWFYPVLLFFLAAMAVSTALSVEPMKSFWSNFERMEGFITLIHLALYFVVVTSVMTSANLWRRFFQVSVAASIIMGSIGLIQLAGGLEIHQGGVRLDATFGNATYLAIYMLFHVFLAALLLVRDWKSTAARVIYPLSILLQVVIIYYTATRGTILGLLGGLFVAAIVIAIFERENRTFRRGAIAVLIAVGVAVGGFFALKDTALVQESGVLSRFASISLEETTTKSRFLVYEMAWQGFVESPKTIFFGWGQESFNYVFNKYYNPGMYAQEQWFDRAHNQFLDWLIAGGILGLIGYLGLFVVALLILLRAQEKISVTERGLLLGLLAGYAFHNLFVFDNIVSVVYFFLILAYLHHLGRREPLGLMFLSSLDEKVATRLALPGAALVVVAFMWFANTPHIATAHDLLRAISPHAQGPAGNLTLFKEVLARKDMGRQEAVEQIFSGALSVARSPQIDLSTKSAFVETAFAEGGALVADHPDNARLQVFMAGFLNGLGRPADALPFAEKAHELSPKKQTILFERGVSELNLNRHDAALATFKAAFELEPAFKDARVLYAMAAVYAGRNDLAKSLLEEGFGTMVVEDERLAKAYFDTKQFSLLEAMRRKSLERNPDSLQTRIQLAAVLLDQGRRGEAIAELEEAIRRNPSFKEQGEFFISEIRAGRNP